MTRAYPESAKEREIHAVPSARSDQTRADLRKSRGDLRRTREELRQLTASLLNAQDAERRRLSRELHDDLSQRFAKLQFDVATVEQHIPPDFGDVKRGLQSIAEQAGDLADDLRRLAHQLHPATLDILGLAAAMRTYGQEFARSSAIEVQFSSVDVPRNLPAAVAGSIYRIAQEALRNVRKHSNATWVKIALSGTPSGIDFSIRDNGIGFDLASVRAKVGLGLIGMEERIRLIDGELSLATRPGRGVRIEIHVPLSLERDR